jgi:hypothetical protein
MLWRAIAISDAASPATTMSARIASIMMLPVIPAFPVFMMFSGFRTFSPLSLSASSVVSNTCDQWTPQTIHACPKYGFES